VAETAEIVTTITVDESAEVAKVAATSVAAESSAPVVEACSTQANSLSQDEVAKRAYILWLERGCPHGDSAQDWFTAIRQLETAK
jgi:hypothetical protein